MPQMSPIMWMSISILMNVILMKIMTKVFFLTNLNFKKMNKNPNGKLINWKW